MVAAADYMGSVSEDSEDVELFGELAERARRGLQEQFWVGDSHFAPFMITKKDAS